MARLLLNRLPDLPSEGVIRDIHLVKSAAGLLLRRIGQIIGGALAPQVWSMLVLDSQFSVLELLHGDETLRTAIACAVDALPVDLLDDLGKDVPGTCRPFAPLLLACRGGGLVDCARAQVIKGAVSTKDNGNCLLDAVLASKEVQGDAVLIGNKRYERGTDAELRYELIDCLVALAWDPLPAYVEQQAGVRTLAELVAKFNNNISVDEYVRLARFVKSRPSGGGVVFNSLDTVMLVLLGLVDRSTYIVLCAYSGQLLFKFPVVDSRATTVILFQAQRAGFGHWLGFSPTCTSPTCTSTSAELPSIPLASLRGGGLSLDCVDAELPADWDDMKVALLSLSDSEEEESYQPTLVKVPPCAPCKGRRCTAKCPRCALKEASLLVSLRGGGDAAIDADAIVGKRKTRATAAASSSEAAAGTSGRKPKGAASRRGQARLPRDVDSDEERELRRIEGGTSSPPAPRQDGGPAAVVLDTPEARMPSMPPLSAQPTVRTAVDARISTVDVKDLHPYLLARNKQLLVRLMSATQRNYENERGTGTVATLLAADHTSDVELTFFNMPVLFDRLRVGGVYCIHRGGSNSGLATHC